MSRSHNPLLAGYVVDCARCGTRHGSLLRCSAPSLAQDAAPSPSGEAAGEPLPDTFTADTRRGDVDRNGPESNTSASPCVSGASPAPVAGGTPTRDPLLPYCGMVNSMWPKPNVPAPVAGGEPTHELKVWRMYADALESGAKTFEFRKDDREPRFAEGDILRLREWGGATMDYSGREWLRRVTYIARGGVIPEGYCCMSIEPLPTPAVAPVAGAGGEALDVKKKLIEWSADALNAARSEESARAFLLAMFAKPEATIATLTASLASMQRELDKWQEQAFRPLGDNHHNAALCPYCSPHVLAAESRVATLEQAAGTLLAQLPRRPEPDENGETPATFLGATAPLWGSADALRAALASVSQPTRKPSNG